jgi:tripartite-type tricarboxylate transporter receptor subunit TctC
MVRFTDRPALRRSAVYRPALLATAAMLLASPPALADPVADFYSGKQIRFVIRSGVGGSYDSYSRLLARHISKHIPGNPSILPVNMPGGGGIRAANYVAKVAPQDGTILTIVSQGLPVDQALGLNTSFQADLRDFNWVGNVSSSNQVLVTWHTSPTKTLADLQTRETVIGSSQAGSISVQMPAVLNNLLGTKIRIVFGYPDGKDINLAMERGEVEGRATNPWASYLTTDPDYVINKKIIPIIQTGMVKEADLPQVPLMRDLARDPRDQAVLDFMSRAVSFGRPIATTPGVPADRVAALRKAFDATLRDPAFIQDAKTQRAEIQPMTGAELAQVVNDIVGSPTELRERVKIVIQPLNAREVPAAKPSGE